MKTFWKYFWNLLIAIDQLANAILGGDPDETISSRMGKMIGNKKATPLEHGLCDVLHVLDKDHCEKSIEEDEGKDNAL